MRVLFSVATVALLAACANAGDADRTTIGTSHQQIGESSAAAAQAATRAAAAAERAEAAAVRTEQIVNQMEQGYRQGLRK
ncbi:hypothetical protein [Caenispirillum bisanense]|uniref:hypothetical protein n=1 Tax=Caenispirillum bisanense TaxID=414052 RepID=UPI0031DA64EC